MQHSGSTSKIETLVRSTLTAHPDCLVAYDLAVQSLVASNAPDSVTPAMKAEVAAAILEFVASGDMEVESLAQLAVRRVHRTGFRLPSSAYTD